MSLISCPECSLKISSKAPACPNCGVPVDTSPPKRRASRLCPVCGNGRLGIRVEYYFVGGLILILIGGFFPHILVGFLMMVIGFFQLGSARFEACSRSFLCGYKKRLS